MEALIIIGFVALVGYVGYQWACHESRMGQVDREIKKNSEIIMREINKKK